MCLNQYYWIIYFIKVLILWKESKSKEGSLSLSLYMGRPFVEDIQLNNMMYKYSAVLMSSEADVAWDEVHIPLLEV